MTNLNLEAANLGIPVYLTGNPFPARCYQNFPSDLSDFISDSPGQFLRSLGASTPNTPLKPGQLYVKSKDAFPLMELLTANPEPLGAKQFKVTRNTLISLDVYLRDLVKSGSIQAINNGQSLSSNFIQTYINSFKHPYFIHCTLCRFLELIDSAAALFTTIRLLIPTLLIFNILNLARISRAIFKPFLRLVRRILS